MTATQIMYFVPLILVFLLLIALKKLVVFVAYFIPNNFPRVIDFIWMGIIAFVPMLNVVLLVLFVVWLLVNGEYIEWKDCKLTRFLRK